MTVVQRRMREQLKASLQVAADLDRERLSLPRRPTGDLPELRGDLTDLEDGALMTLLVELTRWADYSGAQLALADVDERYADSYLDQLKARGLIEGFDLDAGDGKRKVTITELRASKALDPDYQAAQEEKLTAYARRKLLASRHEAFERDAAVVSRELSRRIERDPSQRRTARMGGAR